MGWTCVTINVFSENDKRFLGEVIALCHENKFSIRFPHQKSVDNCGGFFNEHTLATALGKETEEFLSILVHEFSHVEQFLDKSSPWHDSFWKKHGDAISWDYLDGKPDLSPNIVTRSFKASIAVELDCERRAVKNIRKYKLNLDIPYYIQKGNAYLYAYYYFRKNQCWYKPDRKIYEYKEVIKEMPTEYHESANDYWKKNQVVWDYLDKHHKVLIKKKYAGV